MCDIRREEFRLALGACRLRASHYPPTKEYCGVRFSVYCQMSNLVSPGEKFRIPAAESFRKQVELEVQNAMMAARFQHFFFHRSRPQKDLVPCPPCPCCYSQWVVVGADPCRSLAPADPFVDLEAADSWQCLETVLCCKTIHAFVW